MLSTEEECYEAIKNGWDFEVLMDGKKPIGVQQWANDCGKWRPEDIWRTAAKAIWRNWSQAKRIEEYNKWLHKNISNEVEE